MNTSLSLDCTQVSHHRVKVTKMMSFVELPINRKHKVADFRMLLHGLSLKYCFLFSQQQ